VFALSESACRRLGPPVSALRRMDLLAQQQSPAG